MKMKTGPAVDGEIAKAKKIDQVGSKDTTGNAAKPLKSGVKDAGMMTVRGDGPKPIKPTGERLDQWMSRREATKDCKN